MKMCGWLESLRERLVNLKFQTGHARRRNIGLWQRVGTIEVLEIRVLLSGANPQVTSLALVNDTDDATDGITSDPTVVATTSADAPFTVSWVEFSIGGWTWSDNNGTFYLSPNELAADHRTAVTVTAVPQLWDMEGPQYGPTVSLSFTYDHAPTAGSTGLSIVQNAPVKIDLVGLSSDADGDAMTAAIVTAPQHGSVVVNTDGTFKYKPTQDYVGPDSFTYKAYDGAVHSNEGSVAIDVLAASASVFATQGSGPMVVRQETTTDPALAIELAVLNVSVSLPQGFDPADFRVVLGGADGDTTTAYWADADRTIPVQLGKKYRIDADAPVADLLPSTVYEEPDGTAGTTLSAELQTKDGDKIDKDSANTNWKVFGTSFAAKSTAQAIDAVFNSAASSAANSVIDPLHDALQSQIDYWKTVEGSSAQVKNLEDARDALDSTYRDGFKAGIKGILQSGTAATFKIQFPDTLFFNKVRDYLNLPVPTDDSDPDNPRPSIQPNIELRSPWNIALEAWENDAILLALNGNLTGFAAMAQNYGTLFKSATVQINVPLSGFNVSFKTGIYNIAPDASFTNSFLGHNTIGADLILPYGFSLEYRKAPGETSGMLRWTR